MCHTYSKNNNLIPFMSIVTDYKFVEKHAKIHKLTNGVNKMNDRKRYHILQRSLKFVDITSLCRDEKDLIICSFMLLLIWILVTLQYCAMILRNRYKWQLNFVESLHKYNFSLNLTPHNTIVSMNIFLGCNLTIIIIDATKGVYCKLYES